MRRIGSGLIYLLMFCLPFAGYAAFRPVDLNPLIKSGQLIQKTKNLIVLFDKSASMVFNEWQCEISTDSPHY
jgi:hypothetical protein